MNPTLAQRAAAWLLTGPIGHFVAGAVDWVAVLAPAALHRIRRGVPRRSR